MTPEQQAAIARAEALLRAQARVEASTGAQPAGQGVGTGTPVAGLQDGPTQSGRAGVAGAAGRFGPLVSGIGDAAIKGALGVKSLFTDLSENDRLALQGMREEAARDTGWAGAGRTVGEIVGNLAMTAVPAAKAGSVLTRAAATAPRAVRSLAPVAAAAGVSGATGAIITPSEGQGASERFSDKGAQAGIDALLGGGVQAVGSGLRRAATGMFRPSADAVKLMDEGVNPTLAQGAASKFGRSIGSLAAGSQRVVGRQSEELGDAALRRITEGKVSLPGGTGREYADAAQRYISQEYDKVFGNSKFLISPSLIGRAAAEASKRNRVGGGQQAIGEAQRIIKEVVDDTMLGSRGVRLTQREIQDLILTKMREKAAASNNPDVVDAVERARKVILNSVYAKLTPSQLMRKLDIDRLNFDNRRLSEATAREFGESVGVPLARMKQVYGRAPDMPGVNTRDDLIGPAQRLLGATHVNTGRSDLVTLGRIAAPLGLGAFGWMSSNPVVAPILAGAYGISALGQTPKGARFLMGQNEGQKILAESLRKIGPYLYGAGAALPEEGE